MDILDRIQHELVSGHQYILTLGYDPGASPPQRVFKVLEVTEKHSLGPGWVFITIGTPFDYRFEKLQSFLDGCIYVSLDALDPVLLLIDGKEEECRPPTEVEIRRMKDGTIDEVVSKDEPFHIERMDDHWYWFRVGEEHFRIGPTERYPIEVTYDGDDNAEEG